MIKILTGGVEKEDSGEIYFNGEKIHNKDIWQAREKGIGTVFQENSLVPHLSVAENVFLTRELRGKSKFLDFKQMEAETVRRGKELGIDLDPKALVKHLSIAEQQIVEIVKMFSQNPKFVILDEPTSSLSGNEIRKLFAIIKTMQKKGVTFIYISHRMEEIKEIGNGGSVLRDGKFITSIEDVKQVDINEIISFVVGRPLLQIFPERNAEIGGEVLLEAKGICVPNLVYDVDLFVRRGEKSLGSPVLSVLEGPRPPRPSSGGSSSGLLVPFIRVERNWLSVIPMMQSMQGLACLQRTGRRKVSFSQRLFPGMWFLLLSRN